MKNVFYNEHKKFKKSKKSPFKVMTHILRLPHFYSIYLCMSELKNKNVLIVLPLLS